MKTESFVTLEVGRKYLSREGVVDKICFNNSPSEHPMPYQFVGESGNTYTPAGAVWLSSKSDQDLISRIPKSTTLTIQRWGVLWKDTDKLHCSILPVLFKTKQQASKHASTCTWGKNQYKKVVKVKVTYEVLE